MYEVKGECQYNSSVHQYNSSCLREGVYTVPEGITRIADRCFWDIRGEITRIILPEGLQEIGYSAFSDSGLESINIPSTVTTIGAGAFRDCLNSIALPEGLLEIGKGVFWGSGLESINIPSTVKTIGMDTFRCCSSLRNIIVADGDADRIKAMLPDEQKALVIEQRHYDRAMGLIMEKFTSIDNRAINGHAGILSFLNGAFDQTSLITDVRKLVVDYLLDINHKLFKSMQAVAIPRSDNNDEWNKYKNILAQAKNASSSSSSSSSSSAAPSTAFAVQPAASTSSTNISASVNNQNPPSIGK